MIAHLALLLIDIAANTPSTVWTGSIYYLPLSLLLLHSKVAATSMEFSSCGASEKYEYRECCSTFNAPENSESLGEMV